MKRTLPALGAAVMWLALLVSPAFAVSFTYDFFLLGGGDDLGARAFLEMQVLDAGDHKVTFKFLNTLPGDQDSGADDFALTQIGWYDGALLDTNYANMGTSGNVYGDTHAPGFGVTTTDSPGANSWFEGQGQQVSLQYGVISNNPKKAKGVQAGEHLEVTLGLQDGKTFQDVIDGLNRTIAAFGPYNDDNPFPADGLLVFIKVQGIGFDPIDASCEYVHTPVPGSLLFLGTGLFGLGVYAYRRRKKG